MPGLGRKLARRLIVPDLGRKFGGKTVNILSKVWGKTRNGLGRKLARPFKRRKALKRLKLYRAQGSVRKQIKALEEYKKVLEEGKKALDKRLEALKDDFSARGKLSKHSLSREIGEVDAELREIGAKIKVLKNPKKKGFLSRKKK